jgi:hypothetical protein
MHRGRLRGVDLVVAEALDEGGAPGEAIAEEAQHRCGKEGGGQSLGRPWDVLGTSLVRYMRFSPGEKVNS